jgi:hypothetical protein
VAAPIAPPCELAVADASVRSVLGGTANAVFVVTMSRPSAYPVSLSYYTANGTAVAGIDYQETHGVLTLAPGQTEQVILVTVNGRKQADGNHLFVIRLAAPSGGVITDGEATGTILSDLVIVSVPPGLTARAHGIMKGAVATVSGSMNSPGTDHAIIAWGDGKTDTGRLVYDAKTGLWTVQAAHRYTRKRLYLMRVTVLNPDGQSASASGVTAVGVPYPNGRAAASLLSARVVPRRPSTAVKTRSAAARHS